jgi:hypothetical protein
LRNSTETNQKRRNISYPSACRQTRSVIFE